MKKLLLFSLIFIAQLSISQTIGTKIYKPTAMEGYTILAPNGWDTVYLINNCGQKVHQWATTTKPGFTQYLGPDGILYRAGQLNNTTFTGGGSGGLVEALNWNGSVNWTFTYSSSNVCQHHDIELMPNGNVLFIAWAAVDYNTSVANGRDPSDLNPNGLWVDKIIELQPNGSGGAYIVWQWNAMDHLVQDFDSNQANFGSVSNPHKINFNSGNTSNIDWLHINGIDYNPTLDLIAMSSPFLNEIMIIDHSTTTLEAQGETGGNYGKGGDILWRWGNPLNYNSGDTSDQKLFFQHDVQWIAYDLRYGGQIMVFNNRNSDGVNNFSTVDVLQPELTGFNFQLNTNGQFLPDTLTYQYRLDPALSSIRISGAQMQENGNILICSGQASNLIEINEEDSVVWQYECPLSPQDGILTQGDQTSIRGKVFQAFKFPVDYSGFDNQTLTAGNHIEINPIPCQVSIHDLDDITFDLYPNPISEELFIKSDLNEEVHATIFSLDGKEIGHFSFYQSYRLDFTSLPSGSYFIKVQGTNFSKTLKVVKQSF